MKPLSPGRIPFLDAWRGTAVLVMLAWHFCWDLASYGVFPRGEMFSPPAALARMFIVVSFVLLSGISCRFSRDNLARGGRTLLCAAAVTAVMYFMGDPIWFGILHLLGCCMLLYGRFGSRFEKLPCAETAFWCGVLFAAGLVIVERVRVTVPGLWLLGLRTREFYSADYYPLVPWGFLFLAGTVIGGRLRESGGSSFPGDCPAWLCWVGRRALWIYLLHQPLLMGALYLVFGGFPG